MKGSLAAILKSLTLPFGATTGKRILLDGVNGAIAVYDQNSTLLLIIDGTGQKLYTAAGQQMMGLDRTGVNVFDPASGATVRVYSGAGTGSSSVDLTPGTLPGPTAITSPGRVLAVGESSPIAKVYLSITSPAIASLPQGQITIVGGTAPDNEAIILGPTTNQQLPSSPVDAAYVSRGRISTYRNGAEESWHAVAFQSAGWSNGTASDNPTRYRLVPSPSRNMQITGFMIPGATKADGTVIFGVPAGYRPTYPMDVPLMPGATVAGGLTPFLRVNPNGDCAVYGCSAAVNVRINALVPLD